MELLEAASLVCRMKSRVVPGHSGLPLLAITCSQSRGFPGVVTECSM